MDPAFLMQLYQALGLGGGATGGGGVPGSGTPGFGGSGVPYGTPSAGVPTAGIPGAPEDVSPMPVEPPPGPGLRMPTMDSFKSAIGLGGAGPSPMMPPTGGVPFGNPSQSLGAALEPQPAPGTPMPMPRPTGLGAPAGGGGTRGNYGGSPATNPNLRPIGSPAAPQGPADIAKLLGGIKQPQVDVVKPSTPAAHQTRAIGPSDLMALLASLGMGGHRSQRTPTTLGQALELKPSSWGPMYG